MKIEVKLLKPQLKTIENKLLDAQAAQAKQAGLKYESLMKEKLSLTLQYWGDSGENRYPVPIIETDSKVTIERGKKTVLLKVWVQVLDPTDGSPHFIWHILTQGRRTYTFPEDKKSPPLKRRASRRTARNTLNVNPFGGFTGETFVIHGGQTVKGVKGNNWYQTASKEIIRLAKRDPLLKHWLPQVEIVKMER